MLDERFGDVPPDLPVVAVEPDGPALATLRDDAGGSGGEVPGGVGTESVEEEGVTVGALAVVNPFGAVVDPEGRPIAGKIPPEESYRRPARWPTGLPTNTTIAVVATDARLNRERAHLLAIAAHDGLASAVRPAHTMWDGDTVFTLATGRAEAPQPAVERMAERVLAEAIRRAVAEGS
jgi:L-aminopeptidase/D-esterase-like protein